MNNPGNWSKTLYPLVILFFCLSANVQGQESGATINALAIDSRTPSPYFYAATDQGLMTTRDEAVNWLPTGLEATDHPLNDIAIDPRDYTVLFVAAGDAGVLRSSDAGETWSRINAVRQHSPDNRTTPSASLQDRNIMTVCFSRGDPAFALAGSFDGVIYRSPNDGEYWTAVNPDNPLPALNTLAVHPGDPDTLYAGTGGNGVLKSTNGGRDWAPVNSGLTDTTVTRLVIDPADPATIYAGTYGGGVFKSRDGGDSWRPVNNGLTNSFIYSLAIASQVPGRETGGFLERIRRMMADPPPPAVYAGVYGGQLFKSRDGGDSWRPLGGEEE